MKEVVKFKQGDDKNGFQKAETRISLLNIKD